MQAQKYLIDHAVDLAKEKQTSIVRTAETRFAETKPFDQVDQLLLQCDLLTKLASDAPAQQEKAPARKRDNKLKRKLAQKCLLTEFCQMRSNLQQQIRRDNELASARNDLRNLQSQLFTERVAMSTNNQIKQLYGSSTFRQN